MGRPQAVITKRTCAIALMLLVGGAIVNVAVAWGLAYAMNQFENDRIVYGSYLATTGQGWRIARGDAFGASQWLAIPYPRGGVSLRTPRVSTHHLYASWSNWPQTFDASSLNIDIQILQASGWPMFAMSAHGDQKSWHSGIALPMQRSVNVMAGLTSARVHRVLPAEVIWSGFAINTVFYAVILWGLFAAPFALRKRRRIKRGWCPKCAYDLRGRRADATACPECGAAVPLSLGGPRERAGVREPNE